MCFDVKAVLLNYGAFHLLLNELHTAPTAEVCVIVFLIHVFIFHFQIITNEIIYSTLSALYNVVLNSELAKRFRIAITQRLFNYFLTKDDVGIRSLTKFSVGCMHMILSRSEFNKICLIPVEGDMLARCLNGVDSFFGGHENLIATIANLGRNPQNHQVFMDVGIVGMLKSLTVANASTANDVLSALLNMIPEPEISQKIGLPLPLCNPVTQMLTADSKFMELLHNSSDEVPKALHLLLNPTDLETSGN